MKVTTLTGPVANYIAAANAQDVDAVAANFSEAAVVLDEGQSRQGIAAIRQWATDVEKQYRPTVEVLDVAHTAGKTILTGVSPRPYRGWLRQLERLERRIQAESVPSQ